MVTRSLVSELISLVGINTIVNLNADMAASRKQYSKIFFRQDWTKVAYQLRIISNALPKEHIMRSIIKAATFAACYSLDQHEIKRLFNPKFK